MQQPHFSRCCLAVLTVIAVLTGLEHRLDGAEPASVVHGRDWASVQLDIRQLARAEQVARAWLGTVAKLQRGGGWRLKYKGPWSRAARKTVTQTKTGLTIVDNRKPYSTAFTAMQFVYAWETFGEQAHLDVALKTASLYLKAQDDQGWWMHTILVNDGGQPVVPEDKRVSWRKSTAMIQDHVQTGVITLLVYLHRITEKKRFLEAARRAADLLVRAQNPNGSWSHHWNAIDRRGDSDGGSPHGSEINDGATTQSMTTLLMMFHITGDRRYLAAVRRGGEWLLEAQLPAPTWGWASQYDRENRPIWARSFEPPAVDDGSGNTYALRGMEFMYQLTGQTRYLDAGIRCVDGLKQAAARDPEGILWNYYDPKTGRPVMAAKRDGKRVMRFLDTDLEARKLAKTLSGWLGGPRSLKGVGSEPRRRSLEAARRSTPQCLLRRSPGFPEPSQQADRVRTDSKRIDRAIEYLAGRLAVADGEWPVFGETQIYVVLGAIRGARVAIGEIDARTMKTRINDSAHAESHVWPITNRFDTPLKPKAP